MSKIMRKKLGTPKVPATGPRAMAKKVKKRKRASLNLPKKGAGRRRPGFDAFEVKHMAANGKKVERTEVVAPETGIHSLAWAQNITSQAVGWLPLPVEVRNRIYEFALSQSDPLSPQKHGMKFVSTRRTDIIQRYTILSQVCRQTYVDIVGGGMLYKVAGFSFNSPTLMYNYLSCINPAHKASIRSIELRMRLTYNSSAIPRKVFLTLAALPCLHFLELELNCDRYTYQHTLTSGWQKKYIVQEKYLAKIEKYKYWTNFNGLRQFNIKFASFGRALDQENARMLAAQEEIRKVVMKK